MKKYVLLGTILATSLSFGQNTFPANDNVGIGTINPVTKLEVVGVGLFRVPDDQSQIGGLVIGTNNGTNLKLGGNSTYSWIQSHNSMPLYINELGNNTILNLTGGNVGIGTTTPAAKLDVVGDIYIDNFDWSTDNALRIREGSSNSYGAFFKYGLNDLLTIGTRHIDSDYIAFQVPRGSTNVTFNGNVGIGTTIPRAKLDVASDISNGQLGTVFGRLPEGDTDGTGTFLGVKGYSTQGVSGDVKSFSIVHDFYGRTNNSINFYRGGDMLGGFMTFCTSNNIEKMRITENGYIGIGTTAPDEKLTVKGRIHAQEVRVDLQGACAPDYVFQKYYTGKSELKSDYTMPTLAEIESFTKKNHHLPNVPSAQEVQQNGVSLGTMSNVLLQKVEELTLYAIEQQKKLEEQNKIIATLAARLASLEKK